MDITDTGIAATSMSCARSELVPANAGAGAGCGGACLGGCFTTLFGFETVSGATQGAFAALALSLGGAAASGLESSGLASAGSDGGALFSLTVGGAVPAGRCASVGAADGMLLQAFNALNNVGSTQ
jgi:hypothetical protein